MRLRKGELKNCQCGCKGRLALHLLIRSSTIEQDREEEQQFDVEQEFGEEGDFVYDEDNLGNEDDTLSQ